MTNGVMCFPLGAEEGAAGALTGGDVDFSLNCLWCLSLVALYILKTVWHQIEMCVSLNSFFSYFFLNVTLQRSDE